MCFLDEGVIREEGPPSQILVRTTGGADPRVPVARDRGGSGLIARIRRAPKAPLSVAGILATPLFFVGADGVLAEAGRADRACERQARRPRRSTIALIYLLSFGVSALVVLVGAASMLLQRLWGSSCRPYRHRGHHRAPPPAGYLGGGARGALPDRCRPRPPQEPVGSLPSRRVGGERASDGRSARALDDCSRRCSDRDRRRARHPASPRREAASSPARRRTATSPGRVPEGEAGLAIQRQHRLDRLPGAVGPGQDGPAQGDGRREPEAQDHGQRDHRPRRT